ncbi:MAG: ATP-binding cassette domain-containing protein [Leptolyngbya sp. SIO3F4]|nr:ATP-binding cassette domain-containing protein [Leptolyngbya sp. SIO3F4]
MLMKSETQTVLPEKVALSVQGISKKFCRNLKKAYVYGLRDIGSEILGVTRRSDQLRSGEFWALKDIEFQLEKGKSIGFVGANGSGKSTLIRVVGGLLKPDTGSVHVRGRVATLNVLGAGFNPLLSGRENIYINMSILGLSKKEIDQRYDDVLNFAEIWEAIDSPVRTYSSGMRARLGFACAINSGPSILLIDEVLAVGDAKFRTKCYQKLAELREQGTSFVMVSHSSNVILKTCDLAIYLRKGQMIVQGSAAQVMKAYDEDLSSIVKTQTSRNRALRQDNSKEISIRSVFLRNGSNQLIEKISSGKPTYLCVRCESKILADNIFLGVMIRSLKEQGSDILLNLSSDQDKQYFEVLVGDNEFQLYMPYCGLRPGFYTAKISVARYPFYVYDLLESFKFEVQYGRKHRRAAVHPCAASELPLRALKANSLAV